MCALVDDLVLNTSEPVEDDGSSSTLHIVHGHGGQLDADGERHGQLVNGVECGSHLELRLICCGVLRRGGLQSRLGRGAMNRGYDFPNAARVAPRLSVNRRRAIFNFAATRHNINVQLPKHTHNTYNMRPTSRLLSGDAGGEIGKYGKVSLKPNSWLRRRGKWNDPMPSSLPQGDPLNILRIALTITVVHGRMG